MKKYQDLVQGEVLDLHEEIAVVSPTDTPLLTMLYAKGQVVGATDITVSWREKELNGTRTVAQLEGAEAPESVKSTRKMITNICQILTRSTEVSGTLSALNPLGVGDEFASELADRLAEVKRDLEYFALNGAKAEESGVTPRQMNGLINLVNAANVVDAKSTFTAEHIETAMEKMWDKGVASENIVLFCGANVKKKINAFIKNDQFIKGTGSNEYGFQVDRIVTDFGECAVVLDRHMPVGQALIVDLDQVELALLRQPHYEGLAKTGDYQKGQIITEGAIKLLNTYAGAKIINIA